MMLIGWIVSIPMSYDSGFVGIHATDGYRSFTVMTLIMGMTAITAIALSALMLI